MVTVSDRGTFLLSHKEAADLRNVHGINTITP